eukprot:5730-Heterococcus_DN1.PRE.11
MVPQRSLRRRKNAVAAAQHHKAQSTEEATTCTLIGPLTYVYYRSCMYSGTICVPMIAHVRRKQRSLALYTGNAYQCVAQRGATTIRYACLAIAYKPCLVHSCNRVTKGSSAHARCKVQMCQNWAATASLLALCCSCFTTAARAIMSTACRLLCCSSIWWHHLTTSAAKGARALKRVSVHVYAEIQVS